MATSQRAWVRAAGLGALAGVRSVAALALLSRYAAREDAWPNGLDMGRTPFAPLGSRVAAPVLGVLTAGEMAGDKIPGVPNRTFAPEMAVRAGSGAMAGAAVFAAEEQPVWQGAIVGGLAALVFTVLSFHLRRLARERTPVPDKWLGLLEDILVTTAGAKLLMPPK